MRSASISYMFVPASRPERFAKAIASEADQVIIDLEDAVGPEDKDTALQNLVAALEAGLDAPVLVRINSADTPRFARDLEALECLSTSGRASLAGVVVAKAENSGTIARVRAAAGEESEIIALVESARGLAHADELAAAPGLTRFALGAADLSVDLDADIASATIDFAYATLVIASRIAGLHAPIASPPFVIDDPAAVEADARRLRGLGLTAQLCIHPAQLAPLHAGFRPTLEQVAWAQRVAATADGATRVDGQMVDKPVQDRARRILAQWTR